MDHIFTSSRAHSSHSSTHNQHTCASQISEPKIADIMCIAMIVICASVTSTLPKRNVPETYVCQWAQ